VTWRCQRVSIESASFRRLATHPSGGPSPKAGRPFSIQRADASFARDGTRNGGEPTRGAARVDRWHWRKPPGASRAATRTRCLIFRPFPGLPHQRLGLRSWGRGRHPSHKDREWTIRTWWYYQHCHRFAARLGSRRRRVRQPSRNRRLARSRGVRPTSRIAPTGASRLARPLTCRR
jgi:hypothetical protein